MYHLKDYLPTFKSVQIQGINRTGYGTGMGQGWDRDGTGTVGRDGELDNTKASDK